MKEIEAREKEQSIKAIDVAILLPEEISNLAIFLSRNLEDSPFLLNTQDRLPHITLAQGYIDDLRKAKWVMEEVASNFSPFRLTIEGLGTASQPAQEWGGYYFSYLGIKKDPELVKLHEEIVNALPLVHIENPSSGAFFAGTGEEIVEGALKYVSQFEELHSGENFWPHVTLGGSLRPQILSTNLSVEFVCERIVLCQLGNFCTCRRVLDSWKFRK